MLLFIWNTKETEEQRYGRNKSTTVNHTYINGGSYRNKFNNISYNDKLNRLIYKKAKEMLNHRSGTLFEDMYWIDLETLEIVAEETTSTVEEEIQYSEGTKRIVKNHSNLLTIHSHPNSFPP